MRDEKSIKADDVKGNIIGQIYFVARKTKNPVNPVILSKNNILAVRL